jgi:hypothetical protein
MAIPGEVIQEGGTDIIAAAGHGALDRSGGRSAAPSAGAARSHAAGSQRPRV